MLIPKKNRKEVYKYLFREGVIYAKKDFNLPAHPEIASVPNLQVRNTYCPNAGDGIWETLDQHLAYIRGQNRRVDARARTLGTRHWFVRVTRRMCKRHPDGVTNVVLGVTRNRNNSFR